ncbi:hypothetical protein LCGC14_0459390 [marine sediment metagenome]|uniref:Uncharacterized protein n=1 Tax=marine sediment metagenome TaxID=412755 RepID=A0A0F9SFL2_9ZZZZ
MERRQKLLVHISLESKVKPDMERSPSKVLSTLENIINRAVQVRFPEYDVEIGRLEGNWPDSEEEFPTVNND